jgi:6-phosphogluconolactonase
MRARLLTASVLAFAALSLALVPPSLAAPVHPGSASAGAVFTQTNAASGNVVVGYWRSSTGTLSWAGNFSAGGLGSGASLADAGSLALSSDHAWLFAVDAGSDQLSVFHVSLAPSASLLTRTDVAGTGGSTPVSVTVHGDLVFVLNDGNATTAGNVVGFHLSGSGVLSRIASANLPLSTSNATGAAQIAFDPAGHILVVSEKNTNLLDVYRVSPQGAPVLWTSVASNGTTPYGFAFDARGQLIVSDAASGALSSYQAGYPDALRLISGSVPDYQAAPCWVATLPGPRGTTYAFTSDAHGNVISSYTVGVGGKLTLLTSDDANTGAADTDLAVVPSASTLYVYDAGAGMIQSFTISGAANLSWAQNSTGLPSSALGLAAF